MKYTFKRLTASLCSAVLMVCSSAFPFMQGGLTVSATESTAMFENYAAAKQCWEGSKYVISGSDIILSLKFDVILSSEYDWALTSVDSTATFGSVSSQSYKMKTTDVGGVSTVESDGYKAIKIPITSAGDLFLKCEYTNGTTVKETVEFAFSSYQVEETLFLDAFVPTSYFSAMVKLGDKASEGGAFTHNDLFVAVLPANLSDKYLDKSSISNGAERISDQAYYPIDYSSGIVLPTDEQMNVIVFRISEEGKFTFEAEYKNLIETNSLDRKLIIEGAAYESNGQIYTYLTDSNVVYPNDYAAADMLYNLHGGQYTVDNKCVKIIKTTVNNNMKFDSAVSSSAELISHNLFSVSGTNIEGESAYIVFIYAALKEGTMHATVTNNINSDVLCLNYIVEKEGDLLVFKEKSSLSSLIPVDFNEAAAFCDGKKAAVKIDGEYIIAVMNGVKSSAEWDTTVSGSMKYLNAYSDVLHISTVPELYYADLASIYAVVVIKAESAGNFAMILEHSEDGVAYDYRSNCYFAATPGDSGIEITQVIKGDVNSDGTVNIVDALLTLRKCAFLCELDAVQTEAADVDSSGTITAFDALRILQFVSGKYVKLG